MGDVAEVMKHGKISSINPNGTARVTFPDRDDLVSYDLPIMFHYTGFMKVYSMPKVGQPVKCSFLGTGLEDGFIDGGFYNEENPAPTNNPDLHMIKFDDGTTIVYNASSKSISISGVSEVRTDCIVYAKDFITEKGISLNEHKTSGVRSGSDESGVPIP